MTAGVGSIGGLTYPRQSAYSFNPALTSINPAVSGWKLSQLDGNASSRVDPYYNPGSKVEVLVIWGGTNDIALEGVSGTTAYNRLKTYCANRRAVGWKTIVVSMLPRSNPIDPVTFETDRATFNGLLRSDFTTATAYSNIFIGGSWADVFVDIAADSRIGDAGDELDEAYYTSDRVHLINTGYAVVASYTKNAIGLLISGWNYDSGSGSWIRN